MEKMTPLSYTTQTKEFKNGIMAIVHTHTMYKLLHIHTHPPTTAKHQSSQLHRNLPACPFHTFCVNQCHNSDQCSQKAGTHYNQMCGYKTSSIQAMLCLMCCQVRGFSFHMDSLYNIPVWLNESHDGCHGNQWYQTLVSVIMTECVLCNAYTEVKNS